MSTWVGAALLIPQEFELWEGRVAWEERASSNRATPLGWGWGGFQ